MSNLLIRVIGLVFAVSLGLRCPALGAPTTDANWPQFRGPGGRGVSTNTHLPDNWSQTENIAWKAEIPGHAWSSPIVWGQRVFVATAVADADPEPPKKGLYMGGERPNAARP